MLMPIGMLMAFVIMNVANIMEGGDPSHSVRYPGADARGRRHLA